MSSWRSSVERDDKTAGRDKGLIFDIHAVRYNSEPIDIALSVTRSMNVDQILEKVCGAGGVGFRVDV